MPTSPAAPPTNPYRLRPAAPGGRPGQVGQVGRGGRSGPGGHGGPGGSRLLARSAPAPTGPAVVGAALTILAALMLAFLADLAVIGPVKHDRDQRTAFAGFRADLANATAMVNQRDDAGRPYPLGTPMAVLSIPQIGVREVVFEGTTSGVLMSGPGHLRTSRLPGQAGLSVIFGRRAGFGGPFAYLDQLRRGDVLRFTTGQGGDIAYRVVDVRRAGDPVPPAMPTGGGRLTLVTADGGQFRPDGLLLVDADLVGTPKDAGALDTSALPESEQAAQGDPNAWILLVLWGQLLVVTAAAVVWARSRWGRWQCWLAGAPVLFALAVAVCDQAIRLLPNVM